MKIYNWAILGCGHIARKFGSDLKLLPNARLYAAASRDLTKAQNFARELGFEKAYGSYEEMVADPEVDAVYVASPHSHHKAHTLLCLNHQKAVLCEKAFAINSREVREMVDCARKKNTFLMEAFWTRFQPSFLQALEILQSGQLGKLKMLRSDFAFNGPKDPDNRLYSLALGGGSLLDIGVYPVFASLMTLGKPSNLKTLATFSPTGSEESISIVLQYPGGELAALTSGFAAESPVQTDFCCEYGFLRLHRHWHIPTRLSVFKKGDEQETVLPEIKVDGFGYQFEAQHVMECLDAGKTESNLLPLQFSMDLMELLDRIRHDAGICFPNHDE